MEGILIFDRPKTWKAGERWGDRSRKYRLTITYFISITERGEKSSKYSKSLM